MSDNTGKEPQLFMWTSKVLQQWAQGHIFVAAFEVIEAREKAAAMVPKIVKEKILCLNEDEPFVLEDEEEQFKSACMKMLIELEKEPAMHSVYALLGSQ